MAGGLDLWLEFESERKEEGQIHPWTFSELEFHALDINLELSTCGGIAQVQKNDISCPSYH